MPLVWLLRFADGGLGTVEKGGAKVRGLALSNACLLVVLLVLWIWSRRMRL
jgi:hypothetical protein